MNSTLNIQKLDTAPTITPAVHGLRFEDFEAMLEFGRKLANTPFCPKSLTKLDDDVKAASIAAQIQMGLELGFSPMASLHNIAVINGIPSIYGDAALALCRASGALEAYREDYNSVGGEDKQGCKVTAKRHGQDEYSYEFTVADAKRASLWGKAGPWTEYPKRMLMFRARAFCLRTVFPDVLKFGIYEEVRDYVDGRGFQNAKTVKEEAADASGSFLSDQPAVRDDSEPEEGVSSE